MSLADHLDKLRAFQVIVQSGTMREAAVRLNVTQPSLTRLIQTLEHAAQAELLVRGRSGVVPTEAGKVLLGYAEKTLQSLRDLEVRLSHPEDQMAGHLNVGSYESLTEYLWPPFLGHFQKLESALKVSVRTSGALMHLSALQSGDLDLLVDAEPRVVGDFQSWKLYDDRFNFYSSKKAQEYSAETWAETALIYSPNAFDQDNKSILQHMTQSGYAAKEKIELDSFPSALAFCKQGLGVAVLPERLAQEALKAKSISSVSMKGFSKKGFGPHGIFATIHSSRKDDPRIRLLVKSLRDWFKD